MSPANWPRELGRIVSHSPEETMAFGRRLARALPRPTVIVLGGELGSGKTVVAKGLAEGMGVARADDVASPSYTLMHEYRAGGETLYHLDLYRLEEERQLATLGLEDILPGGAAAGGVVAIEWGGKFPLFARLPRLVVTLTASGAETREITAEWRGVLR